MDSTFETIEAVIPSNFDPIELYQLLPSGEVLSLGSSYRVETELAKVIEESPSIHVFFAKRVIASCDPPENARVYPFAALGLV